MNEPDQVGRLVTTNHTEIREWALLYGGTPQIIDDPEAGGDMPGIRINFPGSSDDIDLPAKKKVRDVSWEEFFSLFDAYQLAFIYPSRTDNADPRFFEDYRFIKRSTIPNK